MNFIINVSIRKIVITFFLLIVTSNTVAQLHLVPHTRAISKVYDGLTSAYCTLDSVSGIRNGDSIFVSIASSFFDNKNAGDNKMVIVTYSVTGRQAALYQPIKNDTLYSSITPLSLNVSGTTVAATKVYDGTTNCAVIDNGILIGAISCDDISLTATAAFADKNVDTNKLVSVSYALSGIDMPNYIIPESTTFISSIVPRPLMVTGTIVTQTKVYDGTTDCAVINYGTLIGVLDSEIVIHSASATYIDKGVGIDKSITVNYSISGQDAGNYFPPVPTIFTGSITRRPVTVSAAIIETSKIYDGSDSCHLTSIGQLNNIVLNDDIAHEAVAHYADKQVGNNKEVTIYYSLHGSDSSNYYLLPTSEVRLAYISKRNINVLNLEVEPSKIYDGTAECNLLSGYTLSNVVTNDDLWVTPRALYETPQADTNIMVIVNYTLSGSDSLNYLIYPDTMTADILPRQLFVDSVVIESSKIYNASRACRIVSEGLLHNNLPNDNVSVATSAYFLDSQVGTNVPVIISHIINGTASHNYIPPVSDTLYADILPYQIAANGLEIQLVKQYDRSDSAIILSYDTIDFIYENDEVSLRTIANYNDSAIGTNKSIIVSYVLFGNQSINYMPPDSFVYSENGAILDTTILVINDTISSPFTASIDGFCQDNDVSLTYHVLRGSPSQYKLHFADSNTQNQGFIDVDWTPLPDESEAELISFHVPANCQEGTFFVEVSVRNDANVETGPFLTPFNINLSKKYLVQLFDDVITIDNSGLIDGIPNRFKSFQWYHNGELLSNATKPYYQEIGGLTGAYSVRVKLNTGEELNVCEVSDFLSQPNKTQIVVIPNPIIDIAHVKLVSMASGNHLFKLYDMYGNLIMSRKINKNIFDINLSNIPNGGYILNVDGITTKIIKL